MRATSLFQWYNHPKTVQFTEALRAALIRIGIVTAIFSLGAYYFAETALTYLQHLTGVKLVFYGLADLFFALIKLALAMGLTVCMPYGLFTTLSLIPPLFPGFSRKSLFLFWIASFLLFCSGVIFCLQISLPYGIKFLLAFETPTISAAISVKKFVSFCLLMLFGFGLIFELPLAMMLLAYIGVVDAEKLAGYRRYAILVIFITAAIITPTPDLFNLLLMAVPLYLLFEIGLLGMHFYKKK